MKVVSFLSALLTVRLLGKVQMGYFSLPSSILSIVLIFNGLCMSTASLRFCSIAETESEKKGYLRFAMRAGLLFDIALVLVAAVVLYFLNAAHVYPLTPVQVRLTAGLALVPFLAFAFDMIQNFLRSECDNRNYSKTSVLFTGAFGVFQVLFVLLLQVYGLVAGRYFAYFLSIFVGLLMLRGKPMAKAENTPLSRGVRRDMLRYGFSASVASGLSLIMPQIEVLIVNYFVHDMGERGLFSTASTAPQSIQFLAQAVIIFIFPYFARNYQNPTWIRRNYTKLMLGMSAGMGLVAAAGIALTPLIVRVVFGKDFDTPAEIEMMRIFWAAFAINSALKMPVGNILAALGEVKFNTINAFISTVLQTAICWVMVGHFKLAGAAWGLLCGYLISSVIGIVYLYYYCRRLERTQAASTES